MVHIREAIEKDLGRITEIYNDAIIKTVATFDTEPKTLEEQRFWFEEHSSKYPILVAQEVGHVIGWASLSRWSDRCAYSDTAEISLYIDESFRGRGNGKLLMSEIMKAGEAAGLHTIIARIAEGNEISVKIHENAGFKVIGTMKEVGKKFGKRLDVLLMQKIY